MTKTSAAKNKGICSVVLLSLTLLLGFISAPSPSYNQERQSVPTALVSRLSSSPKGVVIYPLFKKNFHRLFFLSCREIVTRLVQFKIKVTIELAYNLKPKALANRLKTELLSLTLGNLKLSDSCVLRG
jgi:hypothetical protein